MARTKNLAAIRVQLVAPAARLAATTGEDLLAICVAFDEWIQRQGELSADEAQAALNAAVIEAADRHEHLRGRNPVTLATVIARADRLVDFIAARPESLV